jgi:hypothetical protein
MNIYLNEVECLKAEIRQLNSELTEVYGLLGQAHLNIKQHLEYGFNEKTAQSTLISVGRYYPKLKAEMEKSHD